MGPAAGRNSNWNAAKLVCDHLFGHSAEGLTALLQSEGTPSGAPLKLTVRSVVAAHCPALQSRIDNFYSGGDLADANFGRALAAYGGVFFIRSLAGA